MTGIDLPIRRTQDARDARRLADRSPPDRSIRVLAATDGRPQSDLALLAARRLETEETLGILTVLPHRADDPPLDDEEIVADQYSHRSRVEWQVRRVLGNDAKARIEMRSGDPPITLASAAAEHETPLLVVGIGRPKVGDRLLGDESALRLVRAAKTPVLAIAPGCSLPAHSIIVAVDFSPTSFAAARLALRLAAPKADVLLVHVAARPGEIVWGSAAAGFRGDADLALEHWCDRLRRDFNATVSAIVLHGDPATELIAVASNRGADLVAVGAYGHGPATRGEIGSVTARLVRCASYSVVVMPRCDATCDTSVRSRRVPGAT